MTTTISNYCHYHFMIIIRTGLLDLQNFQEFLGSPRDDSESSEKDDKDKMSSISGGATG